MHTHTPTHPRSPDQSAHSCTTYSPVRSPTKKKTHASVLLFRTHTHHNFSSEIPFSLCIFNDSRWHRPSCIIPCLYELYLFACAPPPPPPSLRCIFVPPFANIYKIRSRVSVRACLRSYIIKCCGVRSPMAEHAPPSPPLTAPPSARPQYVQCLCSARARARRRARFQSAASASRRWFMIIVCGERAHARTFGGDDRGTGDAEKTHGRARARANG